MHVVAPWILKIHQPATIVERIRADIALDLLQDDLRERRKVLGDANFWQTMLDEIAARIVALEAVLADRGRP